MELLLLTLLAVFIVSSVSLIGVFFISFNRKILKKIVSVLVAFASGALLGSAFLHLIPEAYAACECQLVFILILAGILLFFLMEKILYWRHCHDDQCDIHAFTYLNIIGDAVHNFIDGIIISAAFLGGIPLGITTTVAILAHEIPQEIGDFAILVHGGFSRKKALFFNFLSALVAVLGVFVGHFLAGQVSNFTPYLLAFSAGGFIYIAGSDLIPELHKTKHIKGSMVQFFFLTFGIVLMWVLGNVFG